MQSHQNMQIFQGNCRKMPAQLSSDDNLVSYQLKLGDALIDANALIGQRISLTWTGDIFCVSCGRKTNKSFAQGHCYPCFKSKASCDLCIMKPETCHHHLGTCREPAWARGFCFSEHVVYLAYTSGVKVGITRHSQVPTRWLDQGAVAALPIFTTSSRRLAGVVEDYFKAFLADKTNWRTMLKGNPTDDKDAAQILTDTRDELLNHHLLGLHDDISQANLIASDTHQVLYDLQPVIINFPVKAYPEKIKSHNFDKIPRVAGELLGIKAQYLILDTGVLNVRKFAGYELRLTV